SAATTGPSPALITRTAGRGGSSSWENGMSRATHSAHSVSRLGLPLPDSNCDSVDLAMPARWATSLSDRPARARSRRSDAAMTVSGAPAVSPDRATAEAPDAPACSDSLRVTAVLPIAEIRRRARHATRTRQRSHITGPAGRAAGPAFDRTRPGVHHKIHAFDMANTRPGDRARRRRGVP